MIRKLKVKGTTIEVDDDVGLSVKELAGVTGHSEGYIYAMIRCGFRMRRPPGQRIKEATYLEYLNFHIQNPDFTYRKAYPLKRDNTLITQNEAEPK